MRVEEMVLVNPLFVMEKVEVSPYGACTCSHLPPPYSEGFQLVLSQFLATKSGMS